MPDAEKDVEVLRQQYNVAVANGLMLQAKRIERRLEAVKRASVTSPADHDHDKCCRYLLCAHPTCCGYNGEASR